MTDFGINGVESVGSTKFLKIIFTRTYLVARMEVNRKLEVLIYGRLHMSRRGLVTPKYLTPVGWFNLHLMTLLKYNGYVVSKEKLGLGKPEGCAKVVIVYF